MTSDRKPRLPTDPAERKRLPVMTGVVDYFTDALAEIAAVSYAGNEQHNPGEPLHWARGKSTDQADTILRHLMERGTRDVDGMRHTAKAAWRILALLQLEIEQDLGLPPSRGSVEPALADTSLLPPSTPTAKAISDRPLTLDRAKILDPECDGCGLLRSEEPTVAVRHTYKVAMCADCATIRADPHRVYAPRSAWHGHRDDCVCTSCIGEGANVPSV